jgi:tryptophanyl-tRNA synthetase
MRRDMPAYLSGIQPTGKFHIGNYFGCIKPFLSINPIETTEKSKNVFLIADMHCYTKPERISNVSHNVKDAVRSLLAAGVDPSRTHIVQQSKVNGLNF